MRKLFLTVSAIICLLVNVIAQNRTIKGRVTDANGQAVTGASVLVKGTNIGTTTNSDGNYSLSVPSNARTLVISSVDMATQEVTVRGSSVDVALITSAASNLQEVVVVGYSTTTKQAFTGSAKAINADRIENKNVSNVSQALAGEVPGVRVINTSGQPGTSATIRIRGIGSVNGNRAPLYVVDGIPFSGALNSINPADIASMTVLKDAAATAIYGSRGANGVIVITTRTGRGEKSFIEVDGKYGTNMSLIPRYDVLSSPEEFIALGWEALYNQGVAVGNADPVTYANTRLFSASGIDPRNNIFKLTGAASTFGAQLIDPVTRSVRPGITRLYDPERWEDFAFQSSNRVEANIRMGGGNAKTNYFTSFGYLDDVGYSINTDFSRLSGRVNLNHEVKSWLSSSLNVNYANTTTNDNGQGSSSNSVFWFVDNIPSIYPLFFRDTTPGNIGNKVADPIFGGFKYDYGATGRKFGSLTNSIADANLNTSLAKRNELTGNTSLTVNFTKSLSLVNRFGVQYYNNVGVTRNNKFYGSAAGQNGSLFQSKTELMNLSLLNMLRYAKRFNSHNVEVLAAHEANRFKSTGSNAGGYNLVDNYGLELQNAIVIIPSSVSSSSSTRRMESYFSQLNYDYNSTYYLSATVRRDGSSRFVGENKWGTFGSVGVGWVISKMNFMQNAKIIDYLKVKASYGVNGDESGSGFYPGLTSISIGNLNDLPSFGVPVPGSPDLTWESSRIFQVGVDFRLGTFLTGGVEYYIKNTDNLIFQKRIGISNGYALTTVNDGQLRNQGIEFELTAHLLKKKDFYLDLGVNGEHFTNEITVMPLDPSTGKEKAIDVQGVYAWSKGHSIYDFYIRNSAGVDPADGRQRWTVYYNDTNGDKTFNAGEQVLDLEDYYAKNPDKIGKLLESTTKTWTQATQYYVGKSAIPKLRGAFNLSGGFKGLELDVQLLYSFGGYAYDGAYQTLMGNGLIGGNNWHTDIRNRWQKAGDITDVPRLSNNQDVNSTATSSRFITKADYLSLNNVRVGYSLPSNLIQRLGGIDQVTFWVSGDNLWLKTERNGFNPSTAESGASSMYTYSPLSTITAGLKLRF